MRLRGRIKIVSARRPTSEAGLARGEGAKRVTRVAETNRRVACVPQTLLWSEGGDEFFETREGLPKRIPRETNDVGYGL